jgi:hypothetical protein
LKLKVQFRIADAFDDKLILSSWLKGAYHLCPSFKDMPKSLFFGMHQPLTKMLVATTTTLCAVDVEDPTHVLGYIVFKNYPAFSVIHWIYVKQQFRYFGLAEALLQRANLLPIVFTSHETIESQRFFNKKKVETYHVPHLRHGEWHESEVSVFLSSRENRQQNDQFGP